MAPIYKNYDDHRTYRIYFNRCTDFPQMWSVDEGTCTTEINVIGIRVAKGLEVKFRVHPTYPQPAEAERNRNEPVVWTEVYAHLQLRGGIAYFE